MTRTATATMARVHWAPSRRPETNQVSARRRLFCYVKRVHLIPDEHGKKKGGSERKKETVEINRPHQMIKDAFAPVSLHALHQCLIRFQMLIIARSASVFSVSLCLFRCCLSVIFIHSAVHLYVSYHCSVSGVFVIHLAIRAYLLTVKDYNFI